MKLTAAMAELSGLKKQNEKHADEGALNSLADEVVAKMAEVEKTFTTKQRVRVFISFCAVFSIVVCCFYAKNDRLLRSMTRRSRH